MRQCILTIGVSASGKTTWAEEFVSNMKNQENELWVNLNRDDIRREIFEIKTGSPCFRWINWNRKWEKDVTVRWKMDIQQILKNPHIKGVILSDTNLNDKTRTWLTKIFIDAGWNVKNKLFPIDYDAAVKRDLNRANPVGSAVIAEQLDKYWKQFGQCYIPLLDKQKAVIVDVDGTLAHRMNRRNVFDFDNVHLDEPDPLVVSVVKGLRNSGIGVVILSGRDDSCRDKTWQWLCDHLGFIPNDLFMRKTGDHRKDSTIKREIFFEHVAPKYNVIGALDDRPQVIVDCWLPLGIKTLVCGNPYIWF